ncbi:MAG TPA: hypothetical protein VMK66_12385 [Myxococcales bacterium]|nr:hypothetical protein [Myxococcales bacterium]
MKRFSVFALLFALIFGLLATWLGPKFITYWYQPPVAAGAASAFHCTEAVEWALGKLVLTQVVGSIFGLLVGIVLAALLRPKVAPPSSPPKAA